jgi:pYEATS domain-containing protein involved in immunity
MESIATIVSSLAWPATILFVGWYLREHIVGVLTALKRQLAFGASLKYKDFEFQGVPLNSATEKDGSGFKREPAETGILDARNKIYANQKNLFVVHRVRPTGEIHKENGLPTYDVSIYLVPHKSFGALNDVKSVEYYFGKYFGASQSPNGTKYIVTNSSEGFAVKLNAYGPMLCEAKILFHDGSEALTNRYLDFEGTGYTFRPDTFKYDQSRLSGTRERLK